MGTIEWLMLLLVLMIGCRLGGMALGLLSGLGLGLLTFSVQPVAPPNDLILLQASWLLLMATLEATGFFYLLENKVSAFIAQTNHHYRLVVALFCYGLAFLTGDKKWLYRLANDENRLHKGKYQLLVSVGIAVHMALLVSPLSISGILLIVVAGNSGLSIMDLVGMIAAITIGITACSSLLTYLMPDKWLIMPCTWIKNYVKNHPHTIAKSTDKVLLICLLLLPAEVLFLCIKPKANGLTELSCIEKIFPVRFPICFALVMLSMAAVVMLWFKIKSAKILQTNRFKLGIQKFFIFLGLTWLLDSLISQDKVYLKKMLCDGSTDYNFYFVSVLYMLLIDIPIIIWLFTPLLIAHHWTTVTIAVWLVVVHSLAPLKHWISSMVQVYKKSNGT